VITPIIDWIFIGAIQGITEWLPISSKTAIMLYAIRVMGVDLPTAYLIALFMQGSTALAGIIFLKNDYLMSVKAMLGNRTEEGIRKAKFIVISLVITGVVGIPLMLLVETVTVDIAILLYLTSLAFLVVAGVDYYRKSLGDRAATSVTTLDSIVVGVHQGIAALPGLSRSAITTLGLLFRGFKTDESLRLSFLTGVPATIGATLISLVSTFWGVPFSLEIEGILVAWATGIVVGFLCMRALVNFSAKMRVWQLSLIMGAITLGSALLN